MGRDVTGLFLLAALCDVLSVPLLNQVYRLSPLLSSSQNRFLYVGLLGCIESQLFLIDAVAFASLEVRIYGLPVKLSIEL